MNSNKYKRGTKKWSEALRNPRMAIVVLSGVLLATFMWMASKNGQKTLRKIPMGPSLGSPAPSSNSIPQASKPAPSQQKQGSTSGFYSAGTSGWFGGSSSSADPSSNSAPSSGRSSSWFGGSSKSPSTESEASDSGDSEGELYRVAQINHADKSISYQMVPVPQFFQPYIEIYNENMAKIANGKKPRIARFAFGDGSGWGNRLRATHYIVMVALYERRMIVIDHQAHFDLFDRPYGLKMFVSDFEPSTLQGLEETAFGFGEACAMWDQSEGDLTPVFSGDLYSYWLGSSPDSCMFKNPKMLKWIKQTFGTESRYAVTGLTVSAVLANPKPEFLYTVLDTMEKMDWFDFEHHAVIQYRAYIDFGPSHDRMVPYLEKFCEDSIKIISESMEAKGWDNMGVWFTSDDNDLFDKAEQYLGSLLKRSDIRVRLLKSPFPAEHSSAESGGGKFQFPLREFYIMGDVDIMLTTGSTFGIFAAARTRFDMEVWSMKHDQTGDLMPHPFKPEWDKCELDVCY